ncbi:MAG: hypothetical protein KJ714_09695 [Euryarchaeota archaeon]|nr:hypothetical protein [Euryarchaeota archaeon]
MSHPMIKVEHMSRQYKIGVDRTYKTFQDAITGAVRSPLTQIGLLCLYQKY